MATTDSSKDDERAIRLLATKALENAVLKQLPRDRVAGIITEPFDISELIGSARKMTKE